MIPRITTITLVFILVFASCKNRQNDYSKVPLSEVKKKFEAVNRALVSKDRERIGAYIERHKLQGMVENPSGLYHLIWGEGSGPKVKTGDVVAISCKVTLLDGTPCYEASTGNPKEFLVGKGGVESGLEMAVLMMRQGQKGKFIMPPHLGHGLLGDNDKIPPMAVLVFDVELLLVIAS